MTPRTATGQPGLRMATLFQGLLVLALLIITAPAVAAPPEVKLMAHRGFTLHQPENSLGALLAAVELGLDGAELDLRTTQDGRIVLLHDADLGRTSACSGPVKDMTWDQVRQCRLKAPLGGLGRETVPSLEQALNAVRDRPGFLLALDPKQVDLARAAALVAAHGVTGRVQFFVPEPDRLDMVESLRRGNPETMICLDLRWWWKIQGLPSFVARAVKARYLFAMEWSSSRAGFAEARAAGAEVVMYLWGQKDLARRAREAADMGATCISCDRPDLLLPVFRPSRKK
jgi:glycerophosphoryl diester phosphodiesterase